MKTNLLEKCSKEELIEIIAAYSDYQSRCDKDEQVSIGTFVLNNAIAKNKYRDKDEYEKNKYTKPRTIEDKIERIDRTEELRKLLFNRNNLVRPRFKLKEYVEDILHKEYYSIESISIDGNKIIYGLKNGPKTSQIEEKYLISVIPTKFINTNGNIIITEAKRK